MTFIKKYDKFRRHANLHHALVELLNFVITP